MLAFLNRNQKSTKKLQPLRKKQKLLINHGSTSIRISAEAAETTSDIFIAHDILSTEENISSVEKDASLSQRATNDSEDNVLFSNHVLARAGTGYVLTFAPFLEIWTLISTLT